MKKLAIAFLAAAIAAILSSFWFSQKESDIQGPSAIAVLKDNSVWISVDEELWQLSAEGQILSKKSSHELGLEGAVGNIENHPSGALVLGIRDQDALRFFNPKNGKIEGSLLPQWPAELKDHASRAINYAFSDKGQIAIATGGGHAVALFDADGQFLRRTEPGLYRFTNGLWWEQDRIWTTNTNQFQLIALSAASMQAEKRVMLSPSSRLRFLGPARASPPDSTASGSSESSPEQSLATVIRFANGMIEGRVVDVDASGKEREFRAPEGMEPRSLAWQGDTLLVVDGKSFAIKQFGRDGTAFGDFGDAAMRAELTKLVKSKAHFELLYRVCMFLAVALFGAGFALAIIDARREQAAKQERVVDPKGLGMAVPETADRWRAALLFGPILPLLFLVIWIKSLPIKLALYFAIIIGFRLIFEQISRRKEWETIINRQALRDLSRPEFARLLEAGETVRETINITGIQQRWLVFTQRRVLVFSKNALDRSLKLAIANADITSAQLVTWTKLSGLEKLASLLLVGSAKLDLGYANNKHLSGFVNSYTTAERIVSLMSLHIGRAVAPTQTPIQATSSEDRHSSWRKQVIASAIIPGLGQWMQARRSSALLFFLVFAVTMLAATIPLIWTLWGPRAEVHFTTAVFGITTPMVIAAISAWDCWNLRGK